MSIMQTVCAGRSSRNADLDYDREPRMETKYDGGNRNYEAIHFQQEMNRCSD